MTKPLDFQYLRNPFILIVVLGLMLTPEFLAACGFDTRGSLISELRDCPNQLMSEIFVEASIMSLMMVVLMFESFQVLHRRLGLSQLPQRVTQWFRFEARVLLIILIGFVAYKLLELFIVWCSGVGVMREPIFQAGWQDLLILGILSYIMINAQPAIQQWRLRTNPFSNGILVVGQKGKILLSVEQVEYVEKEGRKYYVTCKGARYQVNQNLDFLEKWLSKLGFYRVNRSTIIKGDLIKSYTYWENEKYILKTVDGREFTVTRRRLNQIKSKLTD